MRLTINRMLALGLIPTLAMFAINRRNTNQNRAAREATLEAKRRELQQQGEAWKEAEQTRTDESTGKY